MEQLQNSRLVIFNFSGVGGGQALRLADIRRQGRLGGCPPRKIWENVRVGSPLDLMTKLMQCWTCQSLYNYPDVITTS